MFAFDIMKGIEKGGFELFAFSSGQCIFNSYQGSFLSESTRTRQSS